MKVPALKTEPSIWLWIRFMKKAAVKCCIHSESRNLAKNRSENEFWSGWYQSGKGRRLIHDIGKMGIDEKILHKPGGLNPDEWKIQSTSWNWLSDLSSSSNNFQSWPDTYWGIRNAGMEKVTRNNWWGRKSQSRLGLSGWRIPDAMTCDRAYRKVECSWKRWLK